MACLFLKCVFLEIVKLKLLLYSDLEISVMPFVIPGVKIRSFTRSQSHKANNGIGHGNGCQDIWDVRTFLIGYILDSLQLHIHGLCCCALFHGCQEVAMMQIPIVM